MFQVQNKIHNWEVDCKIHFLPKMHHTNLNIDYRLLI